MSDEDVIVPLTRTCNRSAFDCGNPELNQFLKSYALQNMKAGLSRTFVYLPEGKNTIAGYYTLANGQVAFKAVPEHIRRKAPRYPLPVVRLCRLATDVKHTGMGIGTRLLLDAMDMTLKIANHAGVYAIEVDAKDTTAKEFYLKFGFTQFEDSDLHLYLAIKTIRETLDT